MSAVAQVNGGTLIFTSETGAHMFGASFYGAGQLILDPDCQTSTVGSCTVSTNCDPYGPVLSCISPSAGVLSLGGTSLEDGGFIGLVETVAPNWNGTYPETYSNAVFADGDTVTVTAGGGTVPAFQASVIAPGCLDLTSPQPPDGGRSYVIATTQDLQVSWTGSEPNAQVWVVLSAQHAGPNLVDVSCSFTATSGQGTIPQPALLPLAGGGNGILSIYQERSNSFLAGSYQIQIVARNFGGPPDLTSPAMETADASACPYNGAGATFP
jgi:hypothetical protein